MPQIDSSDGTGVGGGNPQYSQPAQGQQFNSSSFLGFPSLSQTLIGLDQAKKQREATERYNQQQQSNFERNIRLQREFAQYGLSWKIRDAQRAGIHPSVALGASGTSFSPVSVGGEPDYSQAQFMEKVGQDLGRSKAALMSMQDKEYSALQLQNARLNNEGQAIDNQIRLKQLQNLNNQGVSGIGTESFIPGQPNSGRIKDVPQERTMSMAGRPDLEPGASPGSGFYVTANGTVVPVPSKDTKQSIEDNFWHETMHFLRNNVMPNITGGDPPPGYQWSTMNQGYRKQKDPHWMDEGNRYIKSKRRK